MKHVLVLGIVLLAFAGCGKDDETANSFTLKGYATSPALTMNKLFSENQSRGQTTGCDGGSSVCCTPGTGCKPTVMNIKVYKVWVSKNEDCSNGQLVADNGSAAAFKDFTANPVLIQGNPDPGTYKCVVLKMSDNMNFKINATAVSTIGGACANTTDSYFFDIYRNTESDWKNYETGAFITGTGSKDAGGDDTVYVYVSTNPAAVAGASVNQVITLGAALTVAEGSPITAAMVVDFTDKINDDGEGTPHCWMAPSTFEFIKL